MISLKVANVTISSSTLTYRNYSGKSEQAQYATNGCIHQDTLAKVERIIWQVGAHYNEEQVVGERYEGHDGRQAPTVDSVSAAHSPLMSAHATNLSLLSP